MADDGGGLAALDPAHNQGYGSWPLPCDRDREIGALVRMLTASTVEAVGDRHCDVLRAFAERMATLARREMSGEQLRVGLSAAGFACGLDDDREVLLILPLLWRSAKVMGLDAKAEFRAVATGSDGRKVLRDFASRRAKDKTLEVMGYIEVEDESGFRYERTW